jgi:hypothetical protein
LPSSKTLPIGFKISIGDASATGECTLTTVSLVTCSNVSTPSTDGTFSIFANLPPNEFDPNPPKVDTAETVNILVNSLQSDNSNFGKIDWVFSPEQGSQAPLAKSTIETSIGLTNFKSVLDLNPTSNTRYTCLIEYRPLTERRLTLPAWTAMGNPQAYIPGSGCIYNLPKSLRGNKLDLSLKATVTDTSLPSQNIFVFYNEYIYRFEGSGTAVGQ